MCKVNASSTSLDTRDATTAAVAAVAAPAPAYNAHCTSVQCTHTHVWVMAIKER